MRVCRVKTERCESSCDDMCLEACYYVSLAASCYLRRCVATVCGWSTLFPYRGRPVEDSGGRPKCFIFSRRMKQFWRLPINRSAKAFDAAIYAPCLAGLRGAPRSGKLGSLSKYKSISMFLRKAQRRRFQSVVMSRGAFFTDVCVC